MTLSSFIMGISAFTFGAVTRALTRNGKQNQIRFAKKKNKFSKIAEKTNGKRNAIPKNSFASNCVDRLDQSEISNVDQ